VSAGGILLEGLRELPEPDEVARAAVRARAAEILRPLGALSRLDEVAVWVAGWQRTDRPSVRAPSAVLFAADHGVTAEGVSAYPAEVTAAVVKALEEGVATASALAREAGAELRVIDVGVGRPTRNIVREPALSEEEFGEAFERGRRAVAEVDADLMVLGEMGIGNTTAAAAVSAALLGGPVAAWTGRGAGLDDAGMARKRAAVEAAVRSAAGADPGEVLRRVGGSELAALAGAAAEARVRSIPVVLDGFVATAAVLPLELVRPGGLDHCVAGHRSPEPGHALLLDRLGLAPLLDLEMRLGEGSGALLAVPIVRMACAAVTEVATFSEWGLG
jgi:nicotinate-nucleotide--dimethylbenzimidazole phosphoribosyltransferase